MPPLPSDPEVSSTSSTASLIVCEMSGYFRMGDGYGTASGNLLLEMSGRRSLQRPEYVCEPYGPHVVRGTIQA